MSKVWGAARAAFASWWAVAGVIAASVTGFNILRKIFRIGLDALIGKMLGLYQDWVHVPVAWIFARVHLPSPPDWAIDTLVLWGLVGGIVFRSVLPLRRGARKRDYFWSPVMWWGEFVWKAPFIVLALACILLWPGVVLLFLKYPHVLAERGESGFNHVQVEWADWGAGSRSELEYEYDLRVVLTIQAVTAMACIGVWVLVNGFLL